MAMDLTGYITKTKELDVCGKKLKFSELTLLDFAQFQVWVQDKRKAENEVRRKQLIEMAKSIGDIDPMELLKYVDRPMTEDEIDDSMGTFEGMSFLVFKSLKHIYPEITLEETMKISTIGLVEEFVKSDLFPKDKEAKNPMSGGRRDRAKPSK